MALFTPSLAVFDVDGTLINSQHIIVAAMTEAISCHGVPPVHASAIRNIIGLSVIEAVRALLPDHGEDDHIRIASLYKTAFNDLVKLPEHDEPLFAGSLEILDWLNDQGWILGLATGKSRRGVARILDRHNLHGRFETIQTADDNPSKPHPQMLTRAMAETGTSPSRTIMIGDTSFDILMSRNANVTAIGVCWGNHHRDVLEKAGAHLILDDYANLPHALKNFPHTGLLQDLTQDEQTQ